MKRLKKWLGLLLLLLIVAAAAIQIVPVERGNPQVTLDVRAPADVQAILRRACYDCHSNETVWPWYSKVAPVSWLVARDVEEGREHLNFSTWDRYSADEQRHIAEEVYEETSEGKMPLGIYLRLHREASLTRADLEALRLWAGAGAGHEGAGDAHEAAERDEGEHEEEEHGGG